MIRAPPGAPVGHGARHAMSRRGRSTPHGHHDSFTGPASPPGALLVSALAVWSRSDERNRRVGGGTLGRLRRRAGHCLLSLAPLEPCLGAPTGASHPSSSNPAEPMPRALRKRSPLLPPPLAGTCPTAPAKENPPPRQAATSTWKIVSTIASLSSPSPQSAWTAWRAGRPCARQKAPPPGPVARPPRPAPGGTRGGPRGRSGRTGSARRSQPVPRSPAPSGRCAAAHGLDLLVVQGNSRSHHTRARCRARGDAVARAWRHPAADAAGPARKPPGNERIPLRPAVGPGSWRRCRSPSRHHLRSTVDASPGRFIACSASAGAWTAARRIGSSKEMTRWRR